MSTNEVSILLEILDLEYLKPILVDRFDKIEQLALANLEDIGVRNDNDRDKLRYALDELQQNPNAIEQYNPILSLKDGGQILTRLENEANLVKSSLNLLFNTQMNSNLPSDDATFDIDYSIYDEDIDQIEADVENLDDSANDLAKTIQRRFPQGQGQQPATKDKQYLLTGAAVVLVLSAVLIFYFKRK